jgi:hypothetical protein
VACASRAPKSRGCYAKTRRVHRDTNGTLTGSPNCGSMNPLGRMTNPKRTTGPFSRQTLGEQQRTPPAHRDPATSGRTTRADRESLTAPTVDIPPSGAVNDNGRIRTISGASRTVLATLADESGDAVVIDPPHCRRSSSSRALTPCRPHVLSHVLPALEVVVSQRCRLLFRCGVHAQFEREAGPRGSAALSQARQFNSPLAHQQSGPSRRPEI